MASGIPAGVIDVGSNTVRLLVARFDDAGPVTLCSGRVRLGLGAELEQLGRVSARKLAEATDAVRSLGALAARHGLEAPEVLVTAPGRQAANARRAGGRAGARHRGAGARVVGDGGGDAVVPRRGRRGPADGLAGRGRRPRRRVDRDRGRPSLVRPRLDQVGRPRCAPADDPAAAGRATGGGADRRRTRRGRRGLRLDRAAPRVRGARRRRLRARPAQTGRPVTRVE